MSNENITREVVIADAHAHFDRVHVTVEEDLLSPDEARRLSAKLLEAAEAADQFDGSTINSWIDEAKQFFGDLVVDKSDESDESGR